MDTYGDMVTLLLTFFVMLYAMSSLDQQKWMLFVQSIVPESGQQQEAAINERLNEGTNEVTGTIQIDGEIPADIDMDTLYLTLGQELSEIGIGGVTITRGEEYTYIAFEDKTFFDGDSSVLTEQGKLTLGVFCDVVATAGDALSQINIMGHTSQGDPGKPNNPRTDRMLSAMRGAEVCIYIQARNVIAPEKLVSVGYGQFRPIATVDTREGRAKNRRVEILMIDKGSDVDSLNQYYDDYTSGAHTQTIVTEGTGDTGGRGFEPVEASPANMATMDTERETAAGLE